MSKRAPMTLAVLSGPDAGKVLRTARPQVQVGSSPSSDLVVRGEDVAPHHFTIIIDASGWRAEPASTRTPIVIDNRWSHPDTGRRGALIYATGTEILVYPGELEPAVLDREVRARRTGEVVTMDDPAAHESTRVGTGEVPRRRRDPVLPTVDAVDDDDDGPTITLRNAPEDEGAERTIGVRIMDIDPLAMSSMPTIGDAPMRDILAGRADVRGRREALGETPTELDRPLDLAPMPQIVGDGGSPPKKSSAWDRAPRARSVAVPEVLAEPESKMQAMPGASKSVVARADDDSAWGSKPLTPKVVSSSERNAWGEASSVRHRAPDDEPAAPEVRDARASGSAWAARGGGSAWGGGDRPGATERPSGGSAWGGGEKSGGSAWGGGEKSGGEKSGGSAWGGGEKSGGSAWGGAEKSSGSAWGGGEGSKTGVRGGNDAGSASGTGAAGESSGSAWGARNTAPGPAPRNSGGGNSGSAWGARPSNPAPGASRSSRPPPPDPRAIVPYAGRELSILHLGDRTQDPGLRVLREPDGELATSIRLFVTRLLDLQRAYGYRAYMLTSAEPLTGKTTVALNLAFALAEDPKRRIALIEANFRHPRMGAVLGLPPDLGLLGILEGRMGISEATAKIADRNLLVFPAGGTHPSPAEALASPRFKTLIQELASSVDIAIVDAPSVKPSADANLILPLVDAALLVVLEQETRGTWVDQAMEQLGAERVLGAVFNRIDKEALKALAPERKERLGVIRR